MIVLKIKLATIILVVISKNNLFVDVENNI